MADNTNAQDELSMEEILSSIKGILSETEETSPEPAAPLKTETAAAPKTEEDDVFDLSASMIVDAGSTPPPVKTENETDIMVRATSEKTVAAGGLPREEKIIDVDAEPIFDPDEEREPLDFSALSESVLSETEDEQPAAETAPASLLPDETSEPDIVPELSIDRLSSLESSLETKENPEGDDVLSLDNVPEINIDDLKVEDKDSSAHAESKYIGLTQPEEEDPYAISSQENKEFSPVLPVEKEKTSSDEKTTPVSEAAEKPEETSEPADVSEAIIDNFARMFNANKADTAPSADIPPATTTTPIGSEKTVSDLVKEVLAESLRPVIEEKLSGLDADIRQTLNEEIRTRAEAWVEANFNRVIEEAVKDEIKRVMAKAGS